MVFIIRIHCCSLVDDYIIMTHEDSPVRISYAVFIIIRSISWYISFVCMCVFIFFDGALSRWKRGHAILGVLLYVDGMAILSAWVSNVRGGKQRQISLSQC